MIALATTSHSVLLVDTLAREVRRVHGGRGLYYGVGLVENGVVVACRDNQAGTLGKEAIPQERGRLLFFDAEFRPVREAAPPFPLRDMHGLTVIDGEVWATCSFDNMVARYNPASDAWGRWYPSPDPGARGLDRNHFNTLAVEGGRLYVVAHNMGPSEVWVFGYPDLRPMGVERIGEHAHDVWFEGGELFTCNSAHGRIEGTGGGLIRTGNFPRGVAFSDDEVLVGITELAPREERSRTTAVVREFSRDWRQRADLVLPAEGLLLDLCALPEGRFDGSRFPLVPGALWVDDYNPVLPGNDYAPGDPSSDRHLVRPDWHEPETTYRWTAARLARMIVTVNPGEDTIEVEAINFFPDPYEVDVLLDGRRIGTIRFEGMGPGRLEASLPAGLRGEVELGFSVLRLRRPCDLLPGSDDERPMGIAVRRVALVRSREGGAGAIEALPSGRLAG